MAETHDLSRHVQGIEAQLHDLDEALREQDNVRLEACTQSLNRALADGLAAFRHAQQQGLKPMSDDLRHRLMLAQTRVTQLQQVLHMASGSIGRTLDILLPKDESVVLSTSSSTGPRTPTAAALNAYRR